LISRVHQCAAGRSLAWRETGSGPSLVLLHGWSLSGAAFTELADHLPGCRLLFPDLPGHGNSPPPAMATLPALADDLETWLAAVAPGPVVLGGCPLGSKNAMELPVRSAVPVERLLLIGTTPRFTAAVDWPHGLPEIQVRALVRNLERRFEATLGDFFALTFAPGEADALRLRAIRTFAVRAAGLPDPATAAALLGQLAEQDQRQRLPAIRCPALVLHGSLDRVTPAAAGRALAAALPHGSLHEFAGLGHAPFWTRPAEVAQTIREICPWGR